MAEEPPTSVRRVDAPPPPPPRATLADVADLVLFCGYLEEGRMLPFLTSSLYNDAEVFIATHAVHYGRFERTRLHYLVEKGHVARLRSFVESSHGGLDVDVRDGDGWTPLHRACELADPATALAIATVLLDAGADPLVEWPKGSWGNALHIASEYCRPDLVRLLLDRGMDVNTPASDDLYTPLHFACSTHKGNDPARRNNIEATVMLLLERGADPTTRSKYDQTSLHMACMYGNDIAIRLLLATGRVDLEARDSNDTTPLLRAARNGRLAAARLLVDAGADVNARDIISLTPVRFALAYGFGDVAAFLRSRGGHE
jgi:ankyrin repeat protein